jgi:DNA-binding winged helix-turn-helix (wHTH) protein/tetratricopeptide (TPR) repeat protein
MPITYTEDDSQLYQRVTVPRVSGGITPRLTGPIAFGPFMVDLSTARVFRDGREVSLRPQVFRVLRFLIQNPGRLVDYDEMLREAWGGARVSKHTVAVTVNELKAVLGEYGAWITIRTGYGYCLEIPESEHLMRVGQHFRSQCTRSGLYNALRCYEQVTTLEGADPRAWEALANLYLEIGFLAVRPPRDVHRSFLQAYHRAVALQGATPGLQLGHALSLYLFETRLREAEVELIRIREALPGLTETYVHLAVLYYMQGRADQALEELGEAEMVDALSPRLALVKPRLLLFCREIDRATASARQAVALHPNSPITHLNYGDILDFAGDPEALTQFRIASTIAPDVPWIHAAEARCLAKQGRSSEALDVLAQLRRNRNTEYVDAYHLAFLLEALGKRDEAFQELERAYVERSPALAWLDLDTKSDPLRNDPRFAELRDRVSSTVFSS